MGAPILFLSFTGLAEPLGQTQVLPYVLGLAARGYAMSVLSYERAGASPERLAEIGRSLRDAGVEWLVQRFHPQPSFLVKGADVARGVMSALRASRHQRFRLLHARSYVAGSVAMALKPLLGARLLFDMRGFLPDERVEGGLWIRNSPRYLAMKRLERALFSAADGVISLTHAGKRTLEARSELRSTPIAVIPTCVDLEHFRGLPQAPRPEEPHLAYLGSFGGRYLIDETVALFVALLARRPGSRFTVLTPSEPSPLWESADRRGLPRERVQLERVSPREVPGRLATVHATVSLIRAGYASVASCPTKFGESLAAGCPVVVNPGIGDCADLVQAERVGVVSSGTALDAEQTAARLLALLEEGAALRERCAALAARSFGLQGAVESYARMYEQLLGRA